ncbi:MAG: HypC/HybG/HupF family hydrogenase formation chaperone [bacterium]|nr:HypC/HybG/HupF family hydrogenase formation chaperone [bacterium]
MCLAVPGEIREILPGGDAVVDFMGVRRKVSLDYLGNAAVGDYVIVHAGFAIGTLDRDAAHETIGLLAQLGGPPRDLQGPGDVA